MIKKIKINQQEINYNIKVSKRTKTMRLKFYNNGTMVVTKPVGIPNFIINYFLRKNANRILVKLKLLNKLYKKNIYNRPHYLKHKEQARIFITNKVNEINKKYNFKYKRISIRNTKTRWGSCSQAGNLNFNYKVIFLPDKVADYIITHEICHLKEMNHSSRFWQLVKQKEPDYKEIRKNLKQQKIINFS